MRLEQHGIFGQVADYNRRLVELSRQAAGGRALVAGDMAPTGLFIAPFGESSFEELVAIYTEQAAALAAAGVDLFLIETTMTMPEAGRRYWPARACRIGRCGLPLPATRTAVPSRAPTCWPP